VGATLALCAAFCFALAATLQQKGAVGMGEVSLGSPSSLLRLAKQKWWLLGTIALLVGYTLQAGALDRGRLAVIQPLLVMTIVFALPLGYWLTNQLVGRREIVGAVVIVAGLAAFAIFADPDGGVDNAPADEWVGVLVFFTVLAAVLMYLGSRGSLTRKAALYGTAAGVLFGLSAALAKPTVESLHDGLDAVLTNWESYAMAITGILAFVIQQVSLGTGKLAPSVATVSVANPLVGITIGVLVLEERLARPVWHIVVGVGGLAVALVGAVVIAMATETRKDEAADDQASLSAEPAAT
jgi:drug/metabolite transporter (DMT)-like permease